MINQTEIVRRWREDAKLIIKQCDQKIAKLHEEKAKAQDSLMTLETGFGPEPEVDSD